MSVLSVQFVGTFCVFQIFRSKDSHIDMHELMDTFINSTVILSLPGALLFFLLIYLRLLVITSRVRDSVLMSSLRKAIDGT